MTPSVHAASTARVRVYLDTSAWSALHDGHVSKARFASIEILFSSCNLDEFVLASPHRAREFARYAWSVSNRKKLLDHLEMTAKEVSAYRRGVALAEFHDLADPSFFEAWAAVRTTGLTHDMRGQMKARIEHAKLLFRDWLGGVRARFKPWFDLARDEDADVAWDRHLRELEEEGYIGEMLEMILRAEGLGAEFSRDLQYRKLAAHLTGTGDYEVRRMGKVILGLPTVEGAEEIGLADGTLFVAPPGKLSKFLGVSRKSARQASHLSIGIQTTSDSVRTLRWRRRKVFW